jgi:hypothetical protein
MAVVALGAALAQQDEGPILRPKPKPATLLVTCDLACNWKLDGGSRGAIAAGESATAPLSLGQHLVDAATQDGLDKVENEVEIKAAGQTVVHLALQPVHDARLKAEQEARDKVQQEAQAKAGREARAKAAQEQLDKEQKERDRAARELAAGLTWTDPATRMMWTKKDNGSDLNWHQAMDYCRSLQLAGHSDWRLPTYGELKGIYDPNAKVQCGDRFSICKMKGNLQLSSWRFWSGSSGGLPDHITIMQGDGGGLYMDKREKKLYRALCVRNTAE